MHACFFFFFNFPYLYDVAFVSRSLWMMKLRSSETMDSESYPQHPGEPDCSYYIRTGLCRFGATCRFNHPRDIGSWYKLYLL
jgi:hypothetical protein